MSNQDLIDQLEADKTRLTGVIANRNAEIANNTFAITTYENNIDYLNNLTATYEADIATFETEIANDDLIIAFIPPDTSK